MPHTNRRKSGQNVRSIGPPGGACLSGLHQAFGLPEAICPDFVFSLVSASKSRKTLKNAQNTPKPPKYVLKIIVGVLDADNLM